MAIRARRAEPVEEHFCPGLAKVQQKLGVSGASGATSRVMVAGPRSLLLPDFESSSIV